MTQENQILQCRHQWRNAYYGVECDLCGLFVPDGSGWWLPDPDDQDRDEWDEYFPYGYEEDEEDEEDHGLDCVCETCIQNYPERRFLFDLDNDDFSEEDCS